MVNIDIDIDKDNLKNVDIDIDIDMAILENIDIDKGILQNIDIDKISYRLGFGISNTPSQEVWVGGAKYTELKPLIAKGVILIMMAYYDMAQQQM